MLKSLLRTVAVAAVFEGVHRAWEKYGDSVAWRFKAKRQEFRRKRAARKK